MANITNEVFWFNTLHGHIGIVTTTNERGEKKIFMKSVDGLDEKSDIQSIKDYGAKLKTDVVYDLSQHIKSKEKPQITICNVCNSEEIKLNHYKSFYCYDCLKQHKY